MNKFKENLKFLRNQNHLKQKDLAKSINVSEDCIYNWEKGRSEPSLDDLIRLAIVLDVTIDYLIGKDEV